MLARDLGHCCVRHMNYHLSGVEYTEWVAFYNRLARMQKESTQDKPSGISRTYTRGRRR